MKLWTKSILGLLSTGAVAGSSLGGLYAYSKSDASKGDKHYSARGLINNINDFKKVDAYNITFVSSINPNTVIGKYDYATDKVDGKDTQQWVKDIIAGGKEIPILHVNAGPIQFENFYPEAIFPKDFVNFVEWFSSDVSWGADISSLSYFRIKRGIEYGESGRTVTLGNYAADKQTTKRIQFIPDSFYGESEVSKATQQIFQHPVSKSVIKTLVELINEQNKELAGHPDKMLKIYSIEKKGDDLYLPVIGTADDSIFKWEAGNPTMLKEVSDDLDVKTDLTTGQSTLVNRKGKHLPIDSKIPNLAIYRTMAGNKWKGLNFNWLKYVTQHEYGHMQTMGMVSDGATSPIQLTPSHNNMPNAATASSTFDLDEINRYLQARLPQLKAVRAKVNLTKPSVSDGSNWDFYEDHLNDPTPPNPKHFNNIAWEIKDSSTSSWTKETIEQIFGSSADVTDPSKAPYTINPTEFLDKIKAGEHPRFFTKSLKDQRALADHLHIPVAATYLMNAFDNMIATTSAGFHSGDKTNPSNVKPLQFLDSSKTGTARGWVSPVEAIKNITSYDGGKLFNEKTNMPTYTANEIKDFISKNILNQELQLLSFAYPATPADGKPPFDLEIAPQFIKHYFASNAPATPKEPTIRELRAAINSATAITVADVDTFLKAQKWDPAYFIQHDIKNTIGTDDGTTTLLQAQENLLKFFTIGGFITKTPTSGWTNPELASYTSTNNLTNFIETDKLQGFIKTLTAQTLTDQKIEDLLKDLGSKTKVPTLKDINPNHALFKVSGETNEHYFVLNQTAEDNEGNVISTDAAKIAELKVWINNVILGQWNHAINGREGFSKKDHIEKIPGIDDPIQLGTEIQDPNSSLNKWLKNPNNGTPPDLTALFANYTYLFPEVLTRDWVQMTYKQENSLDPNQAFRYQSNIAPVQEVNTGIERYLDPSIFLTQEMKNFFSTKLNKNGLTAVQERRYNWLLGLALKGLAKQKQESDFAPKWKEFVDAINNHKIIEYKHFGGLYYGLKGLLTGNDVILNNWYSFSNSFYNGGIDSHNRNWTTSSFKYLLTSPSTTNNGYNVDRWLRAALAPTRAKEGTDESWALYDASGNSVKDSSITIKDFATGNNEGDWKSASDRVRAYWSFFMESRGVGLRTISKIWRVPDRDAFAMWGYIRNEWEQKLKNLTFTNSSTGETKSFPVKIGGNNLFYYEHQGGGDKHTLHDDGYTSWTVDFISLGTWFDSDVQNGDWKMSFTDSNGNELTQTTTQVNGKATGTGHAAKVGDTTAISLFDLGNKERITENGFDAGYAPVIIDTKDGDAIMHVTNQFPI